MRRWKTKERSSEEEEEGPPGMGPAEEEVGLGQDDVVPFSARLCPENTKTTTMKTKMKTMKRKRKKKKAAGVESVS